MKSLKEEIETSIVESSSKLSAKLQKAKEEILFHFSEDDPDYWHHSAVSIFTEVEGICYKLIMRGESPANVAKLLRITASELNTVIDDDREVKYYGLNMRRLAKQVGSGDWIPEYYDYEE